jgi:hypothetical protein
MRRLLPLVLALLAAACGGGGTGDAVDPLALLERAQAAMGAVETASFEMSRAGAPVIVEGLEFTSAVGQYAAPSSAQAVLQMRAGDITIQMGTISVGERTWLTNPLTGRWEELAPGTGFNPAVLFDAAAGWVAMLTDLQEPSYLGGENGTHHLRGMLPPARVEVLTAGFATGQSVALDLWLEEGTGHIRRLELSTTGDAGVSDWTITLSGYGEPVQIDPPATG